MATDAANAMLRSEKIKEPLNKIILVNSINTFPNHF